MMKRSKLVTCFIILGLLAGMLSTGCQPIFRKKVSRMQVITEGSSILYAPHYVALAKGYFRELDLEVQVGELKGKDPAKALSGSAALIVLTNPDRLPAEPAPRPVIFAQLAKDTGFYLLARELKGDFNWSDLKGNSIIGGPENWLPEMALEYLLRKNNLRPQWDLTIYRNVPLAMAPGAFKSGTGSYLLISEPAASLLAKQGLGQLATPLAMGKWELPQGISMASRELVTKDPMALQKFTNGIYLAQLWMARHSAREIAEIIQPYLPDIDQDTLEKIITRYRKQGLWTTTPTPREASLDLLQEILVTSGKAKTKMPFQELTDTRFAREAVRTVKLEEEKKKK